MNSRQVTEHLITELTKVNLCIVSITLNYVYSNKIRLKGYTQVFTMVYNWQGNANKVIIMWYQCRSQTELYTEQYTHRGAFGCIEIHQPVI